MLRLIVYGDIHGCYDEFIQLRNSLNIQSSDVEVCVGDILTKGKDSIKTLRYIQKNNILSVLGNHEDKLLRFIDHNQNSENNPIILDEDQRDIVDNLNADDIQFLKNLPLFIKFESITIVHGGLLNDQILNNLTKKDKGKLLRLRYIDKKGKFIPYGDEDESSQFWADLYDGSEGFVVYGHQNFDEANISSNAIGIDTGCVYGNKLTAVAFNNLNPQDYSIYSTPSYYIER
jgi:diadenosine tetraphosphatase ApaH/serine/threonine PP2A family protein phosphatase